MYHVVEDEGGAEVYVTNAASFTTETRHNDPPQWTT